MIPPKGWEHALTQAAQTAGPPSSDYDLNGGSHGAMGRDLRSAAVLVAGQMSDDVAQVWLTRRSSKLKHHPGQIAFPGGKVDEGDAGIEAAALREAREEIGLPQGAARILGTLPPHETVTGFSMTPVLAWIDQPFTPVPEAGEVAEVFTVPLDHLCTAQNYAIQGRRWRGARRHYYAVPYGPYYIWGATARILRALADRTEQ